MTRRIVPRTDDALLLWSQALAAQLIDSPSSYGLTPQAAQDYAALQAAYAAALKASAPAIRSRVTTATKNTAAVALRLRSQQLVSIIQMQPDLSEADKVAIGVPSRAKATQYPPPDHAPALHLTSVHGTTASVIVRDKTSTRRGRPVGVIGATVYTFVGEQPPTEAGQWRMEGNYGRTRFDITLPSSLPPGTTVWFCACWFNGRKQNGPTSNPVRTNLPGGAVGAVAMFGRAAA